MKKVITHSGILSYNEESYHTFRNITLQRRKLSQIQKYYPSTKKVITNLGILSFNKESYYKFRNILSFNEESRHKFRNIILQRRKLSQSQEYYPSTKKFIHPPPVKHGILWLLKGLRQLSSPIKTSKHNQSLTQSIDRSIRQALRKHRQLIIDRSAQTINN